jgi:hypothetical protein
MAIVPGRSTGSLAVMSIETAAVLVFVLGALTLAGGSIVAMTGLIPANKITARGAAACLVCLAIGFPFVMRVNETASRVSYLFSVVALLCAAPLVWGERARWTVWAAAFTIASAMAIVSMVK